MGENARPEAGSRPDLTPGAARKNPSAEPRDPKDARRDRLKLLSSLAITALAIGALIWRAGA